ncbi:MAG: formate dehydrogenase accessory protein FdhE [Rhodocyclaceae bacterium]
METKPISFNPPTEEAPSVLLPQIASLFSDRAARFSHLANEHSLADWLHFLGLITRAQAIALQKFPQIDLPPAASIEQAQLHGMPPLNAGAIERPAAWRDVLHSIIDTMLPEVPEVARTILGKLRTAPEKRLEEIADILLKDIPGVASSGELPIVAAALQVVWTAMAAQLDASKLKPLETTSLCPCCGSHAVSSIVRLSSGVNNLRYLHCSLCNSEWNVARATCTNCGSDKHLALHQLESEAPGEQPAEAAVMRAESCDVCHSYLKIAYQEKDPHVDPVADDLATLSLDILADESGYSRSGPNLLLVNAASDE